MKENALIVVSLIVLFVIFLVGFGLGYFLNQKKCVPEPNICPPTLLDSKLLKNWSVFARGEVKEISDKNLTLSLDNETIKIFVPEGTRIQGLTDEGANIMNFEDIKVGDQLEIKLWIPQEKTPLTATLVTILP
jgi:hypothetical protein